MLLKFKKLSIVFAIVLVFSSLAFAANEEIVARVNGENITLERFYEVLENEVGATLLQQLIIDELILQKQAELGITIDPNAFALTYANIISQLGGENGYQQFLAQYGITDQQFRAQMEWELTITELAMAEISVTPEDVILFFQQNESYFEIPEQVNASHILVGTETEAQAVINRLNSGEDFAALASELSLDPGTANQGGALGYFGKGAMVPEFENMAFGLGINKYDKVESTYGWHVIRVLDKTEPIPANLDQQWDEVEAVLVEYLASDLNGYVQNLVNEADVEIVRERYKGQ